MESRTVVIDAVDGILERRVVAGSETTRIRPQSCGQDERGTTFLIVNGVAMSKEARSQPQSEEPTSHESD